ncbi:MAG: tRNA preQ1(34) S-adenosylmethionine ribosyltransferase-isomerase QueA [Steroidobacteraceae bacterium]|nr:tRNA preQ1(34) S-adenosylmethionine ribosyltransferase-isomerase QueA [Steroidobacteraceae bacterium]
MRPEDFRFDLPPGLIAQTPLPGRSASRLLTLDGASGAWTDRRMQDLPGLLEAGDLLVFNDTRVVPARIHGVKPTGGRVEMLLERAAGGREAWVQLRASKGFGEQATFRTAGGLVRVLGREADLWRVALPDEPLAFFEAHGEIPLPPYIARPADAADRERYQSVFAREPGAVAAPTASLHFDAPLLAALDARGIGQAFVTLHVGAGTFQPVRAETVEAHRMHAERVTVGAEVCAAIARARAAGRRVVAVGTTVARALEAAAAAAEGGEGGLAPFHGDTRLFIYPGYRFRVIDALLTNFHLPQSTLLMMVCAFAGRGQVLAAYAHAVEARYRFFSYGDAMLVTPAPAARAAGAAA